MTPLPYLLFSLFFLVGNFFLSLSLTPLLEFGRFRSKELLLSPRAPLLFYYPLIKRLFYKHAWENLHFSFTLSKEITGMGFVISSLLSIAFSWHVPSVSESSFTFTWIGALLILIFLCTELLASTIASIWPIASLTIGALFSSLYLTLFLPLTLPLLKLIRLCSKQQKQELGISLVEKSKIRELIRESELEEHLEPSDQQLIASFLAFKGRVAKEIMVPRVDIYALPAGAEIEESAPLFASEGYSRIPIYRESLDQIVGVVLYKDLLKYYAHANRDPKASLESIAKPVLYAPENKKITQLLQEFRGKQIHMAIIVDEYGGTEGIVTIEDILEELVGEIEDEYDIGEEHEFWQIPDGWVVDAKMTIHDIEERLGIAIPTNPEYETIGGYVYHSAGTIPAKGWRLSHDAFDLEVLSSTERALKKIKLTPRNHTT